MKIVIIGPGAMGSLVAAFLAKANSAASKPAEGIWILDKDRERAAKINQDGIRVEGLSADFRVKLKATAKPEDIGKADLVIVCVKSYNTKDAITHARAIVGDSTEVITLQNGIGNIEIISEAVGQQKVIAGVTSLGATLLEPGRVKYAGRGETIIGRLDAKVTVQMRSIRQLFNKSGLEMRISGDIKALLWSKLVINAGINALSAITHLPNGKLIEFEGTRHILREAVTEAIRVAKRKRIKLAYDDPLAKVEAVCEATAVNVSSMLQDVLRKKHTEIDFINGVIVRQGHELGIPVPVNSLLVDLVKTIEASYNLAIQ